jgi:hypothetical protein
MKDFIEIRIYKEKELKNKIQTITMNQDIENNRKTFGKNAVSDYVK